MNKDIRELLEQIENKKAEGKAFVVENKLTEAKNVTAELKELQNKLNILKELEENEMDGVENMKELNKDVKIENKVDVNKAFNKAVLGKQLTEAENALVEKVGEDGGFLVPVEQANTIKELKRELKPLKEYCNVVPVGSLSGTMPIEVGSDDELIDFDEMTEINQSSIKFGQVKFELGAYGDIIPISNALLQDEKANLTTFVGRSFANKAVRKENRKILAELEKLAVKKSANKHNVILDALNMELDPAISDMAIVLTNQTGYDYLDKLEDGYGRPLLSESMDKPGAKFYKGREIVRVSDKMLANKVDDKGAVKAIPFYVGSLSEFITFFDRGVYEMATSTEAGFTKNATLMRVVERFDVKPVDKDAMVRVEITL